MISRRRLITTAAGAGLAVATTGCGAKAAVPAIVAGVTGNAWFTEFTNGIAAELATKAVEGTQWVFTEAWKAWQGPSEEVVDKAIRDKVIVGCSHDVFGHFVPGTSLIALSSAKQWNSATDYLGCVRDTGEHVLLAHWAWKAILAYVKTELDGKEGDARLNHLQLLMATLMPHANGTAGTSPQGTSQWVHYPARDGSVEIATMLDSGKPKVTMTATGLFTGTPGRPKSRTFDLT